jgi:uncharacterized protein with GYD domain
MFVLTGGKWKLWTSMLIAGALCFGAAIGRVQSRPGAAGQPPHGFVPQQAGTRAASYMVLFHFTQQGIQNIKESPLRVESAKVTFGNLGATVNGFYAAKGGPFDTVFFIEAPDEETVARAAFAVEALGNVRTEVVRVFTEEEFGRITAALP